MKKINLKQKVEFKILHLGGDKYSYAYFFENSKGEKEQWVGYTRDLWDIYKTKNNKYVSLWWLKKNGLFRED